MSLFTGFIAAEEVLIEGGYQKLGISWDAGRTFWYSIAERMVAEGHPVFSNNKNQYHVFVRDAATALYPAIVSIRRGQFPDWSFDEVEQDARNWVRLFGYTPTLQQAA
jgi:hypothetical protein